jgi:hypothetical protein
MCKGTVVHGKTKHTECKIYTSPCHNVIKFNIHIGPIAKHLCLFSFLIFVKYSLRWAGHVTRIGETRNAYRILVGKPEGKSPLGRPRRRWVDHIKMDLREIGWDRMDLDRTGSG